MTAVSTDANGHLSPFGGATLTAAAVGVTTAGSIAGTTSAGAAPTTSIPTGFTATDAKGTFTLSPVTGGGAQAAGNVATVRFNKLYPSPPTVILTIANNTDDTAAIVASANNITTAGFDVTVGTALTTAKDYYVNFVVIP